MVALELRFPPLCQPAPCQSEDSQHILASPIWQQGCFLANPILAAEDVMREINALMADYPQLADDEELFRDMLEGNTRFNEIMDRLLSDMRDNETLAEAAAQRIGKIRERQTRLTHRVQFYRGLMHRLLTLTGLKSVALAEAKVSVCNSPEKVIITDENAIPDALCKIIKEPNKTAIKNAIKNGQYVPGASLSNGGTTISVR
jgi:hypothetical protein